MDDVCGSVDVFLLFVPYFLGGFTASMVRVYWIEKMKWHSSSVFRSSVLP